MTVALGQLAPWLVLGLLLAGVTWRLVRVARSDERWKRAAEEAKGNAETRKDVAAIHARDLSRDERAAEAQRVLDARDAARRH